MNQDYHDIETVPVPHALVHLADRRTLAIIRAAVNFPDALRQIARSCYVQGLADGHDAAVLTGASKDQP